MNKVFKIVFVILLLVVFSCKDNNEKETILKGKATIYVDESIFPIVEDQQAVFQTQYEAILKLISLSESEIVNALVNDTAQIAVLPRNLTEAELKVFQNKKIKPKITQFATDAVVFIRNKKSNDTLLHMNDVIRFINGEQVSSIKGLVFDNPNSSTVRLLNEKAGVSITPQKNIYSFNTNIDVIKYVSENDGMIGVVGVDWLFQPPLDSQYQVDKVNVLSVKDDTMTEYVYPSQNNIALAKYPLARDLYIINCQGKTGLGMGFASFISGERGQRIVLKAGLVPIRYPSRQIMTRNKILKDNN